MGCYNKLSQTWWLKTAEIYFLAVLEAKRLKSRCWFCWFFFPRGSEGDSLPCLHVVSGGCQCLVAYRQITSISTSVFSWPLSLYVLLSFLSLVRRLSLDLGSRDHYICKYSQIRLHIWASEIKTCVYHFGDTFQPIMAAHRAKSVFITKTAKCIVRMDSQYWTFISKFYIPREMPRVLEIYQRRFFVVLHAPEFIFKIS